MRGSDSDSDEGAAQSPDPRAQMRRETDAQRVDRNFQELVQELRVAQTGVQILFAFLLSLAFLSDFPRDDMVFAAVLSGALVCSACAACTFIAPVAWHRLLFRQGRKEKLLQMVHRAAMAGLVLLLAAVAGATWLVLAFLWGFNVANTSTAIMVVSVATGWYLLPIRFSRHFADAQPKPDPEAGQGEKAAEGEKAESARRD